MKTKDIYKNFILLNTPRILSLQDRNIYSSTYGCFDKIYWHYKTIADFPSATYQQPVWGLALLYLNDFQGNIYYKQQNLLQWIEAALLYWSTIQHKDGSFDEWFLNERSFCATAFTTLAVTETFLLLTESLKEETESNVREAIIQAGNWLLAHNNAAVANQTLAAMHSLYNIWLITGQEKYNKGWKDKKEAVLKSQDDEGWFPEYAGADLGYSFMHLEILAGFYKRTGDQDIFYAAKKLINFIEPFICPDGSVGAEYGSRNTQHFFPYGLEVFSSHIPEAKRILEKVIPAMENDPGTSPQRIDDKYLSYFYINSFIKGFLCDHASDESLAKASRLQEIYICKNAKLLAVTRSDLVCIASGFWNGAIKIYYQGKIAYVNLGYAGKINNRYVSSFTLSESSTIEKKTEKSVAVCTSGKFVYVNNMENARKHIFLFKIVNATIFHFRPAAAIFNRWLKKRKIYSRQKAGLTLTRAIHIENAAIHIHDIITKNNTKTFNSLTFELNTASAHSPSGQIFSKADLLIHDATKAKSIESLLNDNGRVEVSTDLTFDRTMSVRFEAK